MAFQEAGEYNDELHEFYPPQPAGNDVIKGKGLSLKLHGMEVTTVADRLMGADWLNGGTGADTSSQEPETTPLTPLREA